MSDKSPKDAAHAIAYGMFDNRDFLAQAIEDAILAALTAAHEREAALREEKSRLTMACEQFNAESHENAADVARLTGELAEFKATYTFTQIMDARERASKAESALAAECQKVTALRAFLPLQRTWEAERILSQMDVFWPESITAAESTQEPQQVKCPSCGDTVAVYFDGDDCSSCGEQLRATPPQGVK